MARSATIFAPSASKNLGQNHSEARREDAKLVYAGASPGGDDFILIGRVFLTDVVAGLWPLDQYARRGAQRRDLLPSAQSNSD